MSEVFSAVAFLTVYERFRLGELGADSEGDAEYGGRSAGVARRAAVRLQRVSAAELHVVATRRPRQRDVTGHAGRRQPGARPRAARRRRRLRLPHEEPAGIT